MSGRSRASSTDTIEHIAERLERSLAVTGSQPVVGCSEDFRRAANQLVRRGLARIVFAGGHLEHLEIEPIEDSRRGAA